jgi:SAM-dependent methyltransferase
MTPAQTFNEQQRIRWNGIDGEFWTREQDRLDAMLAPVNGPLLAFAAPVAGTTVIEVGSGCGTLALELARAVGPAGSLIAIDISEPMLGVAKQRLGAFTNADCILGDAAELSLQYLNAELIVSRFGVMFFGDPVTAFGNLATGLAPGGRLRFACWRPIAENPWLGIPLQAVYEHVPRLPPPGPEEPGPFAFGDTDRVTRILTMAGFTTPIFTPLDITIEMAPGGTLEDAALQAIGTGPARRALEGQPDEVREAAIESIRRALASYNSDTGVKLPGGVWLVGAERAN